MKNNVMRLIVVSALCLAAGTMPVSAAGLLGGGILGGAGVASLPGLSAGAQASSGNGSDVSGNATAGLSGASVSADASSSNSGGAGSALFSDLTRTTGDTASTVIDLFGDLRQTVRHAKMGVTTVAGDSIDTVADAADLALSNTAVLDDLFGGPLGL